MADNKEQNENPVYVVGYNVKEADFVKAYSEEQVNTALADMARTMFRYVLAAFFFGIAVGEGVMWVFLWVADKLK